MPFDLAGKRVVVAGHRGMAGSAMVRRLAQETCKVLVADRNVCDLTRQEQTEGYFANNRPDAVIMAAGRVGGILANDHYPVNFLAENLAPRTPDVLGTRNFYAQVRVWYYGNMLVLSSRLRSQTNRMRLLLKQHFDPEAIPRLSQK